MSDDFEENLLSGDEPDRTIGFMLQNTACGAAYFDALHERNLQEHARLSEDLDRLARDLDRLAQGHATVQLQRREIGDHVTVMTETLTTTLTAMNERDARQDRRLAKLDSRFKRVESQVEQRARLAHHLVSDPQAHRLETG